MTHKVYNRPADASTAWLVIPCMLSFVTLQAQFDFSSGLYRFPYMDDIFTEVTNDIWHHTPLGKYDIVTGTSEPYIVAAASGWIRGIADGFAVECHENGNGEPCCWWFNNYVIIEHPNGEWSGYTHMQQHSTSDLGLEVNDWVETGDPLGIEGSVGCSTGPHLHFEVSRPANPAHPFDTIGGFLNGELLIPVMCGLNADLHYMVEGVDYITGPCDDECEDVLLVTGNLADGSAFVVRANDQILTDDFIPMFYTSGSVSQYRAGESIHLRPGFNAMAGASFHAIIKNCNEQN